LLSLHLQKIEIMIAEKNNVVSIVYELRADSKEGEVVESLTSENPMTFLFGTGGLLPKFEEQLNGLKSGDNFEFLLNSEDAYGPVVENAIVKIGSMVPMMDAEGRRLNGMVIAMEGDAVKMDFNHPMAGNDLFFKGEVSDVRSATEEELSHGHIHAEGSCGCGSNGEGSCDDDNCGDKGSCNDDGGQGGQGGCGCGC